MLFTVLFCSFVVLALADDKDGGLAPRLPLNDGHAIPALGLGTFLGFDQNGQKEVKGDEVENSVAWALNAGYRMIDTASAYHNEEHIGAGIRQSHVPREHVFIVTKLGISEKRDVIGALRKSLERLNTTYVDLYLIHNPVSLTPDETSFEVIDYLETWKAMEEAKLLGLAKSIGISNFNISQMERLLNNCDIKPTVLQVEVNLNLAQHKLIEFCNKNDIVVMAYTPFGSLFDKSGVPPPPRYNDQSLATIAERYNKSVPQVVLRYLVQKGVVPIPKSINKERIEENINVFDFQLDETEMKLLAGYNKDYRVVWPSFWQDHPYYSFERKDVPDPDLFMKLKSGKKE